MLLWYYSRRNNPHRRRIRREELLKLKEAALAAFYAENPELKRSKKRK